MSLTMRRVRHVMGLLVLAGGAAACGAGSTPSSPDVWAVVDGQEIKREHVEAAARRMNQAQAASPEEQIAVRLQVLNGLIDQEILLRRARTLSVEVPDPDVEQVATERKLNLAEDGMKEALRRELIVQKLFDRELGAKVTPSDQEVREFYDKNRARFNVAETQYRIAQMVVTPVRDPQVRNRLQDDAATPAEAQKKVAMLIERLKAGVNFGELARDYSEDPESAAQAGDLGFIPASALNQVPPPLRQLVLTTAPGNVSSVTANGNHTFVYVIAREDPGQRDLTHASVRDAITNGIREQREQVLRSAYVAAARNDVDIVNHLARMVVDAGLRPPALGLTAPAP